jgi:DNA-directed RNA polymerase subunit B'
MTEVYADGMFIGNVEDAVSFVAQVREERRQNKLTNELNIYYDVKANVVEIKMSKGRIRRPLIVIKDGRPLLNEEHIAKLQSKELAWNDLVKQGVVEYLDPCEEEDAYIAFYEDELTMEHTHMEITPLAMFSLSTSLVPYANLCLATKVHTGSKSQKQSLGFYAANFSLRMDTDVNLLYYPQVPVVQSVMYDIAGESEHASGQNVVIAILSYEGYNVDDAIILNKSSIDRGLARSTYYRPYVTEELRYSGGLVDEICVPDKDVRGYRSEHDYRFLEEDGIIYPEAKVAEKDVLIGKTSPPRFLSGADEYVLASSARRESSTSVRHGEKGVVDFVLLTENEQGHKFIQVRVREEKKPEIGDKFASRHGQKGVVGMIYPQSDMPFTASGIIPDIIFSPHSIPTRMTISHLLEMLAGKVGALSGRFVDGTTFDAEPEKALREELLSMGFREDGTETMYNGITGAQYSARIFVGNMYYLKLKYMVSNKIQSRARGPIQLLTRQPTEGKAKEGGLRLGEMEKDAFVAHGSSLLLKERFDSDATVIPVCENCGLMGWHDRFKNRMACPLCGENSEISEIEVSYAFKLLLDELKALLVYPKIGLTEKY